MRHRNRSAVLENAAGFARLDPYIYGPVTKGQHWGMLIHWGNKLHVPPNAVRIEMPPALISESFRYLRVSSCMTGTRRCPVSNARRWEEEEAEEEEEEYESENRVTASMTLFPHANSRLHLGTLSHLAP